MPVRRLLVLFSSAAVLACVVVLLNTALFASAVCACGTVDEGVIFGLNDLDAIVLGYRADHGGLSPTYSELQGLVSSDPWLSRMLTPEVDFESRSFTFRVREKDAGRLGYAVSRDRQDYILLGIGLQTRQMYLFGWGPIPMGYNLPIWHPGDVAPDDEHGVIY